MSWNPEAPLRSRFLRSVAGVALALAACAGLAGCGGGGSGGGAQVTIVPDPLPPAQEPPRLVVESPVVSDANPSAGEGFTLSATVRNAGGGSASATLRFYRSDDAAIAPSDEKVGDADVPELAASASFDTEVALPAPSIPGTYYYGACVGAAPGESGAANGCSASARVTVPGSLSTALNTRILRSPPRPDLVVDRFSLGNADLSAGMELTSRVLVLNVGDLSAAPTRVRFYRSDDSAITPSDTELGTARSPWIGDRGSAIIESGTLRAPSTPGTYYYGACLDAVAGESDTTNNCSKSRRVTVPRAPPDLVIVSPRASPADPPIGGGFNLLAAVRNAGGGVTAKTTLRFYHSTDKTITTSDTQVGAGGVAKLAASMTTNHYLKISLLSPSTPGTYYYGACVDAVATESDTTNNCSSPVAVEVSHKAPNLRVSGVGLGPGSTEGTFGLSATLRNVGGEYQGNTWLRFYRSTDRTLTTSDTQVGAVKVERLSGQGVFRYFHGQVEVALPSRGKTYYYGACVDAVPGESNTADNCSHSRGVW